MGLKEMLNGNFKFVVTIALTLLIAAVPTIGGWYVLRYSVEQNAKTIAEVRKNADLDLSIQLKDFREHCVLSEGKMSKVKEGMAAFDKTMATVMTKQDILMKNQAQVIKSIDDLKDMVRNRP